MTSSLILIIVTQKHARNLLYAFSVAYVYVDIGLTTWDRKWLPKQDVHNDRSSHKGPSL